MKVAVLTLTRDRLEYTQHCFASLEEFAGCEYDHLILDQHSSDGTRRWLRKEYGPGREVAAFLGGQNIGISKGMNYLLDYIAQNGLEYDVIVKFDNDCELTQPDTLRRVAELTMAGNAILSPRILGLNNPPRSTGTFDVADDVIEDIPQIGGIFLSVPAGWYDIYRYPPDGPVWGMDDANICAKFREFGGRCGYVRSLSANHYETTSGQHDRYPDYFLRTLMEGKPSL